jgi:hypothetical protein
MNNGTCCFFGITLVSFILLCNYKTNAQVKWENADSDYSPLPGGFHVYKTTDSADGKPFKAFYAIAGLRNKKLAFTIDTSFGRRLTPTGFFNKSGHPLLVVNTTFFSFASNQNLNMVVRGGKLIAYNVHTIPLKGADTLTYRHPFAGAIGIFKNGKADIAWSYTDSSLSQPYAIQKPVDAQKDSLDHFYIKIAFTASEGIIKHRFMLRKWPVQTAVGGGPVLVQNGKINISNNEEMKFSGKAINDKHPRTLFGYTKNNKIIIMLIEGRNPGKAEGASLTQAAKLMINLGCTEALNLDGGGSSCMLINGKETIWPSDKGLQRPVPSVFIISEKHK